ncbi:MAG: 8-amino-7-oxononanoate synthase [Candidatus Omnitrophota bacterium]
MEQRLKFSKEASDSIHRALFILSRKQDNRIAYNGREYIDFSSNDYLSLAGHPELRKAAGEGLTRAVGTSASRLITGTTPLHALLEEEIASFKNKPAALIFNTGYQANLGIISAVSEKKDVIFSDRLNHASIVDGIRLSGSDFFRFRHNDTGHLTALLEKYRGRYDNALIITESLFSMDGDIAPLKAITELKKRFDSILMVDEAHASGVFGENGSGLTGAYDISPDVDIIMGTFSKALGGFGAYAALSNEMRDHMINHSRSFIYSTSLPECIISADLAALGLVKNEPFRRKTLLLNAEYMRNELKASGISVTGKSQIIPLITGSNDEAVRLSLYLREKGFWAVPIRPPTVPRGKARVRVSLTYNHSKETIDSFIDAIKKYNIRYG